MSEPTEWDDILVKFGIKQTKQTDKQHEQEQQIECKLNDDELGFDEDDEAVFRKFRDQRLAQIHAQFARPMFGDVMDIAGQDFVQEVNKAGDDIWVVLHLYKAGVPLCSLINNHITVLAQKFRKTKFLKSVSNLCIANFPDSNLPAIFIYHNGNCKKQLIGPNVFGGMNLQIDELEWMLGKAGAVESDIEENPRTDRDNARNKMFDVIATADDSSDGEF